MFLGYQGDVLVCIAETRDELENCFDIEFTRIDFTTNSVEKVNDVYYIGEEAIKEAKQKAVREYRNSLLRAEVDPVVSNPFRWAEMSEEMHEIYKNYRIYLCDYTNAEGWENQNPMTLDEWKAIK